MMATRVIAICATCVLLSLAPLRVAAFECGDVTGNGDGIFASDALAVLQKAVDPSVDLACEVEVEQCVLRYSRGRLYNGLFCNSGSDRAEASTDEGQEWIVDNFDSLSGYQTLNTSTTSGVTFKQCGYTFRFPGPITIAPERLFTMQLVILESDLYGPEAVALLIIDGGPRDGAPPSEALTYRGVEEPIEIIGYRVEE